MQKLHNEISNDPNFENHFDVGFSCISCGKRTKIVVIGGRLPHKKGKPRDDESGGNLKIDT
jgi:hypothetical protein